MDSSPGGSSRADAPAEASAPQSSAVGSDATVISNRAPGGPTSMAEIGRLLEGTRLGPYELEQFVGGGGMGAVFRALDTTLNRIVAVKVLSRQQSADEEMLRRFRNEAQSAARLDHENIGRVHAVGSEDGWHFIVFEFIEGQNLREVVAENGPFDLARTIDVAIQVADALEHAADRDVVHRDIKPSNIIITPTGRARLVDMGLARLHQVAGDQDLTASGMTLGTFDYISPEQARDPRSADVRSDLYSLGCTIFYMLAGRPPFAEGTMVQKLLQHQQDPPPSIESFRPDVPKHFAAVLARLMAKDPADRQQRPAELIAELVAVAEEEGIDIAASRPAVLAATEAFPLPLEHEPRSVLPWLVPLTGLAAVVGGLWWMSARPLSLPPAAEPGQAATGSAANGESVAQAESDGPWRVVPTPTGDRESMSLGDAVRRAADGDTIELAYDGFLDQPPMTVEGRRITLRAADGHAPGIRFVPPSGEQDLTLGANSAGGWNGCTIRDGGVSLVNVRLRLANPSAGDVAVFMLGAGAAVDCEDVVAELPATGFDEDEAGPLPAPCAFVRFVGGGATPRRASVRMTRSLLAGDGVFFAGGGAGQAEIIWTGGRCITTRHFLLANGAPEDAAEGLSIALSLGDALFACREGFARLVDSSAEPLVPRLQVFAEACRFVVPEGRVLLEQSGIEEPARYRTAIEWLDANSRYEGSNLFRRIDGSAERVEMDYAASPQPLAHSGRISMPVEGWDVERGRDGGEF